jgi:hypothetical protein
MQVVVRGDCAMIAAPVQCDVDGVPKGSHFAKVPSFEVDFDKVASAKEILGTRTLTDTVDAALDEVIKLQQRRRLVELLFTPG